MKTYRSITLLLLFCTSLISGVLIGRKVGVQADDSANFGVRQLVKQPLPSIKVIDEGSADDSQILDDSSPGPEGNGQRNILIIGVDDLSDSSPRLTSVWLIIYIKDSPHMMLLPIYPTAGTQPDGTSSIEPLDRKFKLTPQRSMDSIFIQELKEREIWWTGHIIVDQYALTDVVDFVAGANEHAHLDGVNAITSIPSAWGDPHDSLFGQADLIKELCQNTTGLSSVPRWQYLHLFAMTQDHFSTDYEAEGALDEWLNLLSLGGGISCEFPSMALPSP